MANVKHNIDNLCLKYWNT